MYHFVLFIIKIFLNKWYNFTIINKENLYPKTDKPILYIANHVSWLDALFMAVYLPKDVPFVVFSGTMNTWWAKLLLKFGPKPISVDNQSAYAVRQMVHVLTNPDGPRKLAIYPEGRLTTTGGMMKVQPGAGMIALKTDIVIVPIRLDGVEYLKLNRLAGKIHQTIRPQITMTVGEPQTIDQDDPIDRSLLPKEQRKIATNRIERMLLNVGLEISEDLNLTKSFFNSMNKNNPNMEIIEDILGNKMTYKKLALTSIALGQNITNENWTSAPIGILLPNSVMTVAVILGITFYKRSFHPINFSMGPHNILSVCQTLKISKIITSAGFIQKAKLENVISLLQSHNIEIKFLEDIKKEMTIFSKIKAFIQSYKKLPGYSTPSDETMVILSTSGSEGAPKGVCLSHKNILMNIKQVLRVIDVSSQDRFLNAMPAFHSFGLMGGILLPLLKGAWSFQYPSPLHGRVIPALSYDKNITIAFATDTFLNIWARNADAYAFYKIRAIVAGAERVKPETKSLYAEKFGVRILEGYGATETSPVISLNTFIHSKPGTVGKLLPGMEAKIETVPGIQNGGRLFVSGPNVMQGYLLSSHPGELVICDKWYDTGDIVNIDDEGFITILGRAKRFAKIAGEMVSLPMIENIINQTFEKEINDQKNSTGQSKSSLYGNAVISVPDDRKGEKLIWITTLNFTDSKLMINRLSLAIKEQGVSELAIPKIIEHIDYIPLLGTGKINYPKLTALFSVNS